MHVDLSSPTVPACEQVRPPSQVTMAMYRSNKRAMFVTLHKVQS